MGNKIELVDRVSFIKAQCEGKKVLHLGCTNYPYTQDSIDQESLLHYDLKEIAGELYGFDFDQKGLDILEKQGTGNLFQADLEKLERVDLNQSFEVIIAGEMIEHLDNPGLFMQGIKRFMDEQTKLVITTINAYSIFRFLLYALRGKGGENEPVHPDHVSYYSYKTLKLVIDRNELDLDKFYFYDIGLEHRVHLRWYHTIFNDIGVKFAPQLCDGVIAICSLRK